MNTLHIIGAIVLLSLTALNSQRHQVDLRQHQMQSEVEMRATALGTRLLDQLATLPFDANASAGDIALLTPPSGFGGALTFNSAARLDAVHGLTFVTTEPSSVAPLPFEVSLNVRYLSQAGGSFAASAVPTAFKEVTAVVTSEFGTTVTVRRIYSLYA